MSVARQPLAAVALAVLATASVAAELPAPPRAVEFGGIRIEASVEVETASQQAIPRLKLTDVATGAPVRGAHLLAWLTNGTDLTGTDERSCASRASALQEGGLGNQAHADFNGFRLLSLTDRGDIIALNPTVSLGGTQIEAAAAIGAEIVDAAMDAAQDRLALALRGRPFVRLLDPVTLKTVADVGIGGEPAKLAWSGDKLIAATAERITTIAGDRVAAVRNNPLGTAPTALVPGGGALLVAAEDRIAIFDTGAEAAVGGESFGSAIAAAQYSPLARAFWVLLSDGRTFAIGSDGRKRAAMAITPLRALFVAADGRHLLGIDRTGQRLILLDGASGAERSAADLSGTMDRFAAGTRYAYVYGATGDTMDLANLAALDEGRLELISVPVSEHDAGGSAIRFDRIATMPSGAAVIASPSGRSLAYYEEGMMAPMGSIPHYGRRTIGLFAVDNSLREQQPGLYVAHARYLEGGAMTMLVTLDQPRSSHCFAVTLPRLAGAQKPAPEPLRLAVSPDRPQARVPARLTVAARTVPPGTALRLLVRDDGSWQRRVHAIYEADRGFSATVSFPAAGLYHVTADAPRLGHRFGSQSFDIVVEARP